jgi:hypothetical protein
MNMVSRSITIIIMFQIFNLSISSMSKAEDPQICVNTDGCSMRPHIMILSPAPGSQLQMSECRLRYVVVNAPAGAVSRVFVAETEFEFFRNGKKTMPFVSSHFDEALTVDPGYWDIQVDSNS